MVEYHARDAKYPSLLLVEESLSRTVSTRQNDSLTLSAEVARAVETRTVEALLALAANTAASAQARAITRSHLHDWYLGQAKVINPDEAAHIAALRERIEEFERSPEKFTPTKKVDAPPGMPIGDEEVF